MQPSCSPAQAGRDLPSLVDLGESSDTKSHFPPPTLGSLEQQGLRMQLWHGASAMRWDLMDNWGAGALGNGLPGKPAGTGPFPQLVTPLWIQGNLWDWTEFTSWKSEPVFPNLGELGNQGIQGKMLNSRYSGHISYKFSFLPASKDSPVSSKGSSAEAASESSPGTASDARCQIKAGWKPRILPECSTAELKAFLHLLPGHLLGPDQIQWVTGPEFGHSWVCACHVCAWTDFIFSLVGL